jgi:hypothetical protein
MLAPRHSRMPLIVRLFSSVWFGITMLGLILIYASIFSALPQIRGALELTEMAAFQHWLFTAMIVLFSISLVTVTLVRIRWTVINLGVLTVHAGLVLLVIGSTWYFYTKVEGDTLLLSPRVEVLGPTGTPLRGGSLLCEPGSDWSINAPMLGGEVTLNVTDVKMSANAGPESATVRFSDQTHDGQELTLGINKITQLNQQLSARLVVSDPVTQFTTTRCPHLTFDRSIPIRTRIQIKRRGGIYPIHHLPIFASATSNKVNRSATGWIESFLQSGSHRISPAPGSGPVGTSPGACRSMFPLRNFPLTCASPATSPISPAFVPR